MKKKIIRPFMLAGLIISCLVFTVVAVYELYTCIKAHVFDSFGPFTMVYILIIVMSAMSAGMAGYGFTTFKLEPRDFELKKKTILTTISNCVGLTVLLVFNMVYGYMMYKSSLDIAYIVCIVLLIMSMLLMVFDLSKHNKQYKEQFENEKQEAQQNTEKMIEERIKALKAEEPKKEESIDEQMKKLQEQMDKLKEIQQVKAQETVAAETVVAPAVSEAVVEQATPVAPVSEITDSPVETEPEVKEEVDSPVEVETEVKEETTSTDDETK